MKMWCLSLFLLSSTVTAGDRKVPPRTPDDRLNTLQRFLKNWINDNISSKRPSRGDNFADRKFFGDGNPEQSILLLAYTAVDSTYGVPKCSYYNPSNLNHGGPRMSNEPSFRDRKQVLSARWRMRRQVVDDEELEVFLADQIDLVERLPELGHEHSSLGRRLDEKNTAVIRSRLDFFDVLEMAHEMGRSMTAFERLSSDPNRAWQQIRMGYLKWVARYTSDCPKERIDGSHSNTLMEYFEKLRMLTKCLSTNTIPTATVAQARVQFIYGEGTADRALYRQKLAVNVEPISCSV